MSDTTEVQVIFTVPENYANEMHKTSKGFYLDVFGRVRDMETTAVIGRWERLDGKTR